MLVALHTLFMREHNRLALELSQINPHWDDERLFQVNNSIKKFFRLQNKVLTRFVIFDSCKESRHIVAALVQQITYNEFLPMVLGKEVMERYNLLSLREVGQPCFNLNEGYN